MVRIRKVYFAQLTNFIKTKEKLEVVAWRVLKYFIHDFALEQKVTGICTQCPVTVVIGVDENENESGGNFDAISNQELEKRNLFIALCYPVDQE